jgi:hypothetical protein
MTMTWIGLRGDELESELLLDRGIKTGMSVGIIAGARRIAGAVALERGGSNPMSAR